MCPVIIAPGDHAQPVNDIRVPWSDLMPGFVEIHFVTTGDNWRQRKILVVRHRRRNYAGKIKMFAFGFPFEFELVPSVPAAPVFLGIKQRNQRGETGEAKKKPL